MTKQEPRRDDDEPEPQKAPVDDPDTGEDEPSDEGIESDVPPGFDPASR